MTRALQTIPQEPEEDTSAEIYLTGAYFLLPFGSVLLLGLIALRVPGAQILAVAWYIFFLSFGPALIAAWCLYKCGAYDEDALRTYDARWALIQSELLGVAPVVEQRPEHQTPPAPVVDAATRRRRAAEAV